MGVPIKHIIGTIALIALVIGVGLAYTMLTSYIEAEVASNQLRQIAEHVSLNLVEIINLVNFANSTGKTQTKIMKLPSDLGGKAYVIMLVNETTRGCYVQTRLVTRGDVAADSLIPLRAAEAGLSIVTDEKEHSSVLDELVPKELDVYGKVYGGDHKIAVWAVKENTKRTLAGIGLWKPSGG